MIIKYLRERYEKFIFHQARYFIRRDVEIFCKSTIPAFEVFSASMKLPILTQEEALILVSLHKVLAVALDFRRAAFGIQIKSDPLMIAKYIDKLSHLQKELGQECVK